MQKTSFQATDATTKSSDPEDNEKRGNFLFIYCTIMQLGKMMTR
jgi:hypothetical protein